jgi:hypothetical protein
LHQPPWSFGHPVMMIVLLLFLHCLCPSWFVGKELDLSVPFDRILGLEFFHMLNRIVVAGDRLDHFGDLSKGRE